jgi:pimeloyl-ACP methyl ester carboxylesterase
MNDSIQGYCSWCFRKTTHHLDQKNTFRRNVRKCSGCGHYTLLCRSINCGHLAKGHSKEHEAGKKGSMVDNIKEGWHAEFCAQHDGTVPSFECLDTRLHDIADFRALVSNRKINLVKVATLTSAVVSGVVIIGFTAGTATPAVAAALGNAGWLGLASTGTAIASLSGAALTSASLAAIGSGGVAIITAVGGALGGVLGGVVSNRYVGAIKDFDVIKKHDGRGASVVFVNGFLNQKNDDLEDWREGANGVFQGRPWYLITWESKTKASLGQLLCRTTGIAATRQFFVQLAKRAAKKAGGKLNPAAFAAMATDLLGNDWHTAMTKAAMTGIVLADLISRTPRKRYILVGHSLGCRVIYYALEALSTRAARPLVKDVVLLGGAVGADDEAGWSRAVDAIYGKIYNCFSSRDGVLTAAYQGANAFLSEPIGLRPISYSSPKIENWDCSEFIDKHMEWKPKLDEVLQAIDYS